MEMSMVRRASVAAMALAVATWAAKDARADGLTLLPDEPAGITVTGGGVGGAATTSDGETGFDPYVHASWTVSESHVEVQVEQNTSGVSVPIPLATGSFVFTVDAPLTYTVSGAHAYFPAIPGTSAFGISDYIVSLKDVTADDYLFANSLLSSLSSEGSYEVGVPGDGIFLEGSTVGTLVPGHVYELFFWVQTFADNETVALAAESVFRLDVAPLDAEQLAELAEDLAFGLEAIDLADVLAPNAASAAGRLASLVSRVEDAAEAIAAGNDAAAVALLTSVRDRIDGDPTPADWLAPSAAQEALLEQVDALIAALD
jgi:hypothetical protein